MRKRNKYKLDSYYNKSTKMRNWNTEMERIILIKEKKKQKTKLHQMRLLS